MGDIENKERKAHYKRIIAFVLAVVLITQTFFSRGGNWFINAQSSDKTTEVTNGSDTVNAEGETVVADGINIVNEPNMTQLSEDGNEADDTNDTNIPTTTGGAGSMNVGDTMDGTSITDTTMSQGTSQEEKEGIDAAGLAVSENATANETTENQTSEREILSVAVAEEKQLEPGDWLYIDTETFAGGTGWKQAGAQIRLWYVKNGASVGCYSGVAEEYSDYMVRIRLPEDMSRTGTFVIVRMDPDVEIELGGTTWNETATWNQSADLVLNNVPAETNTYKITAWGGLNVKKCSGEWYTNNWIQADYSGKTLYFQDYTGSLTTITAHFSADKTFANTTDMPIATVTATKSNSNSNLFSVVIPGEQHYVKFVDADGNRLGKIYNLYGETETDTTIESVLFAPGTNDTFHYHVTEKSANDSIDVWSANPATGTASLAGKILYFDTTSFLPANGGTLYIGNDTTGITLEANQDEGNILSYQFPTDTTATQQTILTFETSDGTKYHFMWSDSESNKVVLSSDIATVSEKYARAVTVYYDATLSKLPYSDADDYAIPNRSGTIRYYATGNGMTDKEGDMELVDSYSTDGNTWSDVYKVELPEGYEYITFSSFDMTSITNYGGHGESTSALTIPVGLTNPCFYADSSDTVIYDGVTRDGYWAEVYSVRDAETGKSTEADKKDVVDINQSTFTKDANTLYVNSTFYDYYTDYELNGWNRDNYPGANGASYRNWVTFRQFNQALSDYYKENSTSIQIYTGHFQPNSFSGNLGFGTIQNDLQLYGYNNYNPFISTNNSNFDSNGNSVDTKSVAQGLVSNQLVGSELVMNTTNGVTISEPHFDEAFLTGTNSKNAVLGEVYQNVSFPFTQKDVDNNGVQYWCFDSSETTLAMRQDSNTKAYYLKDVGNQNWSKNVDSSSTTKEISKVYGFFPFNETSAATSAKNYNYGFGVKLEFNFRLTSDGTVIASDGSKVPITFAFSGDDDVWVYIDDKLVLDVGGAHGFATGKIDFQSKQTTVDYVKASAGSSTAGTNVTSSFTLDESSTQEHTLTMYYMERGMWESNMKIQFNFPDENTLEVEKQVDKTAVNELFQNLFDGRSLFTFHIENQATHYGTKAVSTGEAVLPVTFNASFKSDTIRPSATGNTFAPMSSYDGQTGVAHWYAKLSDTGGAYRDARYGIIDIDSTAAGGSYVDISNMSYLEFKFYYDYPDTPALYNMYLQLVDSAGNIMGNTTDYLSGKTYGIPTMANRKWVTVKIDLSMLEKASGFNNQVVQIKFGYNYPRDIYLDDFIFCPSAVSSELVGFVKKQYDIPDYGSAESGRLEIPEGAVYSSSTGKNQFIGSDGTFVLQDEEIVTFSDQFRRGSYIHLEEESNDLFSTSYTMYENEEVVTSFGTGTTVNNGSISSLNNVAGTIVNDDRTETVQEGTETSDGITIATKNSYITAVQPKNTTEDSGKETFVFRSYESPDSQTTTTKLKVVYTNKVKVGGLTIAKDCLYENEKDNLTGTYEFRVTFSNIGGISLENEPITTIVSLKVGENYTITGIPLGTSYTIEEITLEDGAYLGAIEVTDVSTMSVDANTQTVTGAIAKEAAEGVETATFKNTKEPKISVAMTKVWQDEVTKEEVTENLPSAIYVQLQRKKAGENDDCYTVVPSSTVNYSDIQVVPTYEQSEDTTKIVWKYEIAGLDKLVDYSNNDYTEWVYRFVELDEDTKVVDNGKVVTITGSSGTGVDYQVQYGTPEADETTGDYSNTISNIRLSDMNLKLIKTTGNQRLAGVTFKLENYDDTTEAYSVEASTSEYKEGESPGGEITFTDLPNGTYRLTELKTAEGYTLLKEPLIIVIDRKKATYTYRMESETTASKMELAYDADNQPTITLTIHNASNIILPPTGVKLPFQVVAIGIFLCMVSGIMYRYDKRKCRKEGKPPGA